VLPAVVNVGYEDMTDSQITEVNGQQIGDLRELVQAVENSTESVLVFTDGGGSIIPLDRVGAERENPEILETYGIPSDRSDDLR
jgi:PDZ domain